jgi:hypothetical protein
MRRGKILENEVRVERDAVKLAQASEQPQQMILPQSHSPPQAL